MKAWIYLLLVPALRGDPRTCDPCHKAQSAITPMTRALQAVERCELLQQNPHLEFRDGIYHYSIVRDGNKSIYSVTDGKDTITVPLGWAFGVGNAGQTYVFQRNGKLYESRVSFFNRRGGLDLTMGAQNRKAANLEEAAGRSMTSHESAECFACHATNAIQAGKLRLDSMKPGLQCVHCHPGGESHVTGIQTGNRNLANMAKLTKLTTEEMSNFCGQCHRTWADISANGPYGINNVRFQPYRLTNSRCYDALDLRISCVACHNPHQSVAKLAASYDAKCNSCHIAPSKTCSVAKQNCTTCHMPKLELPGANHRFTDHQIRIVRANEAYPN